MRADKQELNKYVELLCSEVEEQYTIDPHYYEGDAIKRGLRNADGTGVMAGVLSFFVIRSFKKQYGV